MAAKAHARRLTSQISRKEYLTSKEYYYSFLGALRVKYSVLVKYSCLTVASRSEARKMELMLLETPRQSECTCGKTTTVTNRY
jgi:hypothetical protein